MGGKVAIAAEAVSGPQKICSTAMKPEMPMGRVVAARGVKIMARRNSFQEKMKQKTPVATSPGLIIGRTTLHSTRQGEQPSIRALSSTEMGTSSMRDFIIQMPKGPLTSK